MQGGWVHMMTNRPFGTLSIGVTTAIQSETSIKRWPRLWKLNLIETQNPFWDDLFERFNG